jgi:hypothetical protein
VQSVGESSDDIWRGVLSIDLDGPMFTSRQAIPPMIAHGGGRRGRCPGMSQAVQCQRHVRLFVPQRFAGQRLAYAHEPGGCRVQAARRSGVTVLPAGWRDPDMAVAAWPSSLKRDTSSLSCAAVAASS